MLMLFGIILIAASIILPTTSMMTYNYITHIQNASGQPIQGAKLEVYAKTTSGSTVLWQTLTSNSQGEIEVYSINPNYQYITSWKCYASGYQTKTGSGAPPTIIQLTVGTGPEPTPTPTPSPSPSPSPSSTPTPPPASFDIRLLLMYLGMVLVVVGAVWTVAERKKR